MKLTGHNFNRDNKTVYDPRYPIAIVIVST